MVKLLNLMQMLKTSGSAYLTTNLQMLTNYIGLALLMPLLIGGIFGKEAGLGAWCGSPHASVPAYCAGTWRW